MSRTNLNKFFSVVGLLVVATLFIGLGLWQWDRAQENRKPVVVNQKLVELNRVAKIGASLPPSSLLRNVVARGRYIAVFKAPRQFDNEGVARDWEVSLLQTTDGAILVVRGLWSERSTAPALTLGEVEVTGRLLPHQYEDTSAGGKNSLQRIDSAVIVDKTDAELLDGYILATAEKSDGTTVARERIEAPAPRSAVPGFYWQHISYVIIWWLMAAIVLYLPFYQRRVTPEQNSQNVQDQ
jgi:surfeit locus 1 family protein